jgi:putative spermidine/putrescine transport system substrate-binding protein
MDTLIAAAKVDGSLNTIALPRDWCNYGSVIDGFKSKYGLAVNELSPNASAGEEVEAILANKEPPGDQAPDVIDVPLAFGPEYKAQDVLQPYKVSTWDSIPANAKDADGYWYGDYYGVLVFMVNMDVIQTAPRDWADLLRPEYKATIGLSGDPRTSIQAVRSVFAAALATGGSLDNARPGLDFFSTLNKIGNLVTSVSNNNLVSTGVTPIRITWDYNAQAGRDQLIGKTHIEVIVPASGRFADIYVQAISKYAPHPNAAKLWMEYLYSDEGQLLWLAAPGYCHPIREPDLETNGKIPAELLARLPSIEGVQFPTADQFANAKKVITEGWDSVVGADIRPAP